MNDSPRSTSARRSDGLTPLALAAGLAFGHIVAAMADAGRDSTVALATALVFTVAASAGTLCLLFAMAERGGQRLAQQRAVRWVLAIGAGWVTALAPGLF